MVDNSMSPHGGLLVERVVRLDGDALNDAMSLPKLELRDQLARECVNLAYGFFSPLEGFMGREDLDSVANNMTLASDYVWSIPILLDVSQVTIDQLSIRVGDRILLTYQRQPLALMDIQEIYNYDKHVLCQQIYGTNDIVHPGVQRTNAYNEYFVAGPITLINVPIIKGLGVLPPARMTPVRSCLVAAITRY